MISVGVFVPVFVGTVFVVKRLVIHRFFEDEIFKLIY